MTVINSVEIALEILKQPSWNKASDEIKKKVKEIEDLKTKP